MKRSFIVLILLLMSISLVACNSNDSETQDQGENIDTAITVEHAAGTTNLEGAVEKVVVLDWIYGEEMLSLGVQPMGMSDISGYNIWMNSGDIKLDESVVDLGNRGSANIEDIAALNPDLIVTPDYYEYDYNLLSEIAPTVVLTPYPGEEYPTGEYDHMIDSLRMMGKVLGLEDKAEEVISGLDTAYEEAREILSETDVNMEYIELIDFSTADTVSMYLYTDTSIHTTIMEKLGFTNLYKPDRYELFGQTNINVENLVGLDDNTLFVVADKGEDVFSTDLISEDVLNDLGFYANDNIYYLGTDASPFGPLSTLTFVDRVVEAVMVNDK